MNNQNPTKTNYINLNDYDLPRYQKGGKYRKNCYHCPVCSGKLEINPRNGEIFTCFSGGCARADIRKAVLALAGDNTPNSEWEATRAARAAKSEEKLEAEKARVASLKNSDERHKDWLGIVGGSFLSEQHFQDMLNRGYTPELIDLSKAISSSRHGGGRIIPVTDYLGRMVGGQVITTSIKPWYGTSGTNHLRETGEIPLTVIYPANPKQERQKNQAGEIIKTIGYIAYTESTGDKPFLCAHQRSYVTIGSSITGSQPRDLKRSVEYIKQKYGWDEVHHILMADGGSLSNNGVMIDYCKLKEQIAALGGELQVGWWGQYTKSIGDIDEISQDTPLRYIPFERFEKFGEDRKLYDELSQLTIKPTTVINERFLPAITPKPRTITFINSPCATGKTEQLKPAIDAWISIYPNAKVIDIVHLNAIKDGHQQRLGIFDYRVGYGQNDEAINGLSKISICLDSLLRLQLENIPPHSLLILDEMEAILKHAAQGQTLGINAPALQAHLTAILDRVLITGGAVIGLEDSLTNLSVQGLLALTGNRYKYELIKNEYQPYKWKVAIGNGNNANFLTTLLSRLKAGENILAPNSSQNFGEAVEKLVLKYLPELAENIYRIDAKTSPDLQALLANPNKWLAEHDVRLLIGSPTIQSSFNSSNQGQFDRVMARFANLDTRAQVQILHRDRSDVPRDIQILKQGAEVNNRKNAKTLLKSRELIANRTSLMAGHGRITNNRIGDVWNRLDAEFSARAALSAAYLEDYLRCDLAERGHIISPANWQPSEEFIGVAEEFKQIRQNIKVEENRILFAADGHALTLVQATSILHSSGVRFEIRQQAKKTLLHHDLPGVEFTEEFLMAAITEGRGAYLNQCKLGFFLNQPVLAKYLDRERFTGQLAQPHIMFSQVPKLSQKIDLFTPILPHLEDLASGREFKEGDPALLAIQAEALKQQYWMQKLFQLDIKPEQPGSTGRQTHTEVATTNKILRKLGYTVKKVRAEGVRGAQVRVYAVTNADCQHRQTICEALELKYRNHVASSSCSDAVNTNLKVEKTLGVVFTPENEPVSAILEEDPPDFPIERVEEVAAILELAVAHPTDYLALVRSEYGQELLTAAAQLLPAATRSKLRDLVLIANREVAA
jgi:hypothetical protein